MWGGAEVLHGWAVAGGRLSTQNDDVENVLLCSVCWHFAYPHADGDRQSRAEKSNAVC